MMLKNSVYDLLRNMQDSNIIFAYKGDIDEDLLDAVYALLEKQYDEGKITLMRRKKFFQVLTESLQNVWRHRVNNQVVDKEHAGQFLTGFVIRKDSKDSLSISTGNLISAKEVSMLGGKIDHINNLSPDEMRTHYQKMLAASEFSDKGGAGLGLLEMARKSGNKLEYEFVSVNEAYSFFCLTVKID